MVESFWQGRKVFLTGHTGFKGAWAALWLSRMGARVYGYALAPATEPNLFELARVANVMERHQIGDVRDAATLSAAVSDAAPDIVLHMAAQSLVRAGYDNPVETFATNVLGTVHLLEAVRRPKSARVVLIVTSDKCYENRGVSSGYRETDPLGGDDPYSASKACAELVTHSYHGLVSKNIALASVRAGNVIGGGDWAQFRLIPDLVRAFSAGREAEIRYPEAVRPWQHVLEPLSGYFRLCERLAGSANSAEWNSFNFGPEPSDAIPVSMIADRVSQLWGPPASWRAVGGPHHHEAGLLFLDITKAKELLGYRPRWGIGTALTNTVAWYREFEENRDMRAFSIAQIAQFEAA